MTGRSKALPYTPDALPPTPTRARAGVEAPPHLDHEARFWQAGCALVAGVDEAGRGAWAGPVFAGAVIVDRARVDRLSGVTDSKRLSPRQRSGLYELITAHSLAVGVGQASVEEIDALGILPATRLAMRRAVEALSPRPQALIVDAVRLPQIDLPQAVFNFADSISLSVAAASIIAKVARDRLMIELDAQHPAYGFARHKGYGTRIHQAALQSIGPCALHRRSFKPINRLLARPLL